MPFADKMSYFHYAFCSMLRTTRPCRGRKVMHETLLELQLRLELAFYSCGKQTQLKNNCKAATSKIKHSFQELSKTRQANPSH